MTTLFLADREAAREGEGRSLEDPSPPRRVAPTEDRSMTRRQTDSDTGQTVSAGAQPLWPGWVKIVLRLVGSGLLFATAAIHLDLYVTGYRTIPTIGWLFLLQVISAF